MEVNVPNLLTLCRFALIIVYIAVFSAGHFITAFIIIVIAGATDILDGYWARSRGQITELGKMLDPLADKCLMIVVIVSLLVTGMIRWEAASLIFFREIGMIVSSTIFHLQGKKTVPANILGKFSTVLYYFVIMFIFFEVKYAGPLMWTAIAVSYLASIIYFSQFRVMNHRST